LRGVEEILRSTPWMMDALVAAREVDAPDWLIGAGAVRTPGPPWDATNQAAVHLWYADRFGQVVERLGSTEEGVATWPETATCVAVRLEHDGGLELAAPYGLDDLLGMVHRRNPARVSVEEYERRLRTKRISERWPLVRVL
jgi:hypothetical protein